MTFSAATLLRYLLPLHDPEVKVWSGEARLLRTLTFAWMSIGLIVLFSASFPESLETGGNGLGIVLKQVLFFWLGLNLFNLIVRRPLKDLFQIAPWGVLIVWGLILATKTGLGVEINGAKRWLQLGPLLLQPSELMKPFLVLQSAAIFGNWVKLPWKVRLFWIGVFALVLASILLQPNLSTTALCGMSLWLIALASGLPFSYLTATALLGLLTAAASVTFKEYQRQRIISFLDPFDDARGAGYQLVQSLYAIASGGVAGAGYGLSQQKLFYLPIQTTDFIFAVFAEEFGLIGCLAFLTFLMLFASLGLRVALRCRHRVKRLAAVGGVILLVGQSLLNIGVASGALPTTGLPLPFFSYGGSSCLASLLLAGLIVRVAREGNSADVMTMPGDSTPAPKAV